MNDRIPRTKSDHVLVDVKAKPSGWPTASLDPDSGRSPQATSGMQAQTRRSTKSGLYGFRGLPVTAQAADHGRCHRSADGRVSHISRRSTHRSLSDW